MDAIDRLCLDKTIFIESSDNLSQHHIDGIRFIYRQYKKKKAGVIINDGPRSRRLQIGLFIRAVCRQFIEKPSVLVLCEEGTEHYWKKCFSTRTDLGDDVVIETSKMFPKKAVVISPLANAAWVGARHWRLVVIDDDSLQSPVLNYAFNSDFKIWSSSVNMKKNLDTFTQIYRWIYPKEIFNRAVFTTESSHVKDLVDKAILLDAFMEDIVVRRKDLEFEAKECQKVVEASKPVSKKNKDATGTKIKRSRQTIKSDNDEDSVTCSFKIQKPTESVVDDHNNLARAEINPVTVTSDSQLVRDHNINDTSQDMDMNLYLEPDSVTELDSQVYENKSVNINELDTGNAVNNVKNQYNEIGKENINNDDKNQDNEIIKENIENDKNEGNKTGEGNIDNFDKSKDNEICEIRYQDNVGVNVINIDSEEPSKKKPKIEENDMEYCVNIDIKPNQSTTKDIIQNNINGGQNKLSATIKDKPESVIFTKISDKNKIDEFENKKNELMEQALKRFKGSVFDSLF